MQVEGLLKKYKLRNTQIRRSVIEIFQSQGHALSHQIIERELDNKFDRVTLYRTLKAFEEAGLIHRIANDKDRIEYALCGSSCANHSHKHVDNHVHFKCNKCAKTFCLEHTHIPAVKVPELYKVDDCQMLLTGICASCNTKAS
ncbi:MAG: transcriptional repressor [Saprospiraceae bacterium]|nr:transcriptional repressor [Saprospiraceae bacterium]